MGAEAKNQEVPKAEAPVAALAAVVSAATVQDRDGDQKPPLPETADEGGGDADTNVWPTATEEAAFLSEARERGEKMVPVARETIDEAEEAKQALPPLDELVNRIPAETRDLLDELFRAKFVAVRRVRKRDLKS